MQRLKNKNKSDTVNGQPFIQVIYFPVFHRFSSFFCFFQLNGATYSSKSSVCCGGVGRNLAEGVSRILGGSTFISAVGDDQVSCGWFRQCLSLVVVCLI